MNRTYGGVHAVHNGPATRSHPAHEQAAGPAERTGDRRSAWRVLHGLHLYGAVSWPGPGGLRIYRPDSYGPFAYYAYIPFVAIFPPAPALVATLLPAVCFDALTLAGLYKLGGRLGGRPLAQAFMFAYLLYPFPDLSLTAETNDALIAALCVWAIVAAERPVARGQGGTRRRAGAARALAHGASSRAGDAAARGSRRRAPHRCAAALGLLVLQLPHLVLSAPHRRGHPSPAGPRSGRHVSARRHNPGRPRRPSSGEPANPHGAPSPRRR